LAIWAFVGVLAEGYYPPSWPGDKVTISQLGEFATDANPTAMDIDLNPNGTANLAATGDFAITVYLAEDRGHIGMNTYEFSETLFWDGKEVSTNGKEQNTYRGVADSNLGLYSHNACPISGIA